jgi:hypothetical protein
MILKTTLEDNAKISRKLALFSKENMKGLDYGL